MDAIKILRHHGTEVRQNDKEEAQYRNNEVQVVLSNYLMERVNSVLSKYIIYTEIALYNMASIRDNNYLFVINYFRIHLISQGHVYGLKVRLYFY